MEKLRGSTLTAELRGSALAAKVRLLDVLNDIRNAADCRGVISARAIVEYPGTGGRWGLRRGFNVWDRQPSEDFPISVVVNAGVVSLWVPPGFRPHQAERRDNDRAVDHRFMAITGRVRRPAAELSLA